MIGLANMTIGKKLIFSGVITTTVAALLLTGIALWQGNRVERIAADEIEWLAMDSQEHIVASIIAMVTSQQEVLQEKVASDLNVARDVMQQTGTVGFGEETIEWQAANQYSQAQTTVRLPKMMVGNIWLGQNADTSRLSPVVDRVRELVGGTCTIFQRMNEEGDMLRVTTNVETLKKKRAIGTYIPAKNPDGVPNPVLQKVLAGERFMGRAFVVNKWYVTAYEPIRDSTAKVVGVLYTGVPEESAASLRREIMNIKVGKTGYVYIVDPKGQYIISKNGKRDGENIWEAKDAAGNLFIQDIVKRGQVLKPGEFTQAHYPWKNSGDPHARYKTVTIGYFAPWQWIIGAGTWDEEFKQGVHAIQTANSRSRMTMLFVLTVSMAGVALLWLVLARGIVRPIRRTVDMLKDISEGEGDLTKRLDSKSRDEVGELACCFNAFVEKIQGIIKQVAGNASQLTRSSQDLSSISTQLASGADKTSAKATTVAVASEEMSTNMNSVAAAMEHAASNLNMVASAAEEMTATISEIAHNTEKARTITEGAVGQAAMATEQVGQLGNAAQEIDKVVETITDISEQVNLLALNATIEAARAGEAGKGFAVVANEIKELARQTAAATGQIKQRVEGIRHSTDGTVSQIQTIAQVVSEINMIVDTIATAVEEQSVTTKEIAGNVAQSSAGLSDVNVNLAQSSQVAGQIAEDIASVTQAAGEMSSSSSHVNANSAELARLAEQLDAMVGRFRV
jgi:methyl-accepting chemotaxis protein